VRYAESVRASGEALLALINDILDFSKIEAGKLALEAIDFDLNKLLDDVTAMMALRAEEKGLKLVCASALDVPSLLRGDPGRLRQVLVNLVGNAVKFTSEGEVSVRVMIESENDQEVVLRISVRDTGIGIQPDKHSTLFDKFTQVDASTTRKYGGTGLGLAISKQLAELMGGKIGVESGQGRGAVFWFTSRFEKRLPEVLGEVDGPKHSKSVVVTHSLRQLNRINLRVLVAEDNITNQQVALGILRKLGLTADVVTNGREALEALRNIPYDLVFMDVQMPELDGLEATRVARTPMSGILNRAVPIIAMTAHAMQGDKEQCLAAGMDDYIAKPVTLQAVSRLIDKWLAKLDATSKDNGTLQVVAVPHRSDPVPGAQAGAPVLNETALVDRLMGDRHLAQVISRAFVEDMPKQIEALRGFLDASNAPGAFRQAHTIKGAAAAVGGEALMKLACKLEQAGQAGDLNTVKVALGDLQYQFDQLSKAMVASDLLDGSIASS